MTTLVVSPIRTAEPGSYRERRQFVRLLRRLKGIGQSSDPDEVLAIFDEVEAVLLPRLKTDDGTPVEDVLDKLSANEFDALLAAIALESGVGEASKAPSSAGPEGSRASTPTG